MTEPTRTERQCPRCAASVPDAIDACPRCGLAFQPGVAYFDAGESPRAQGSAAAGEQYEHKHVSCLPMDLERVARAEAVDGWALTDTTVDPEGSGNIRAHFRRARWSASAPARREESGQAAPAKAKTSGKRRKAKSSVAPKPDFGREPATPQLRGFLFFLFVLATIVILAENFGIVGLILGLIFIPGILRSLVGGGRRRRR